MLFFLFLLTEPKHVGLHMVYLGINPGFLPLQTHWPFPYHGVGFGEALVGPGCSQHEQTGMARPLWFRCPDSSCLVLLEQLKDGNRWNLGNIIIQMALGFDGIEGWFFSFKKSAAFWDGPQALMGVLWMEWVISNGALLIIRADQLTGINKIRRPRRDFVKKIFKADKRK